jgi:[acyl-carrier-protein] S-malonyltransferase
MTPEPIAFLFPGQGTVPTALPPSGALRETLLAAVERAGVPLRRLIEASDPALLRTDAAQPAILIDSVVKAEVLRARGVVPALVAGHSLGEYAALVAAGVLSPQDALAAVLERGRLMAAVPGAMAAILKLPQERVTEICQAVEDEVGVANRNAPTQTVISGTEEGVSAAMGRVEELGGRAIRLKVSGPFHSPLMADAQADLAPILSQLTFAEPLIPFLSSVSGAVEHDPQEIKRRLLTQITACVSWVEVMSTLDATGIQRAVEVGPGEVLTRLGRRSGSPIRFVTYEEAIDGAV